MSSKSEKCSDDQEASRGSPSNTQSPEVTSKATERETNGEESNDSMKILTQKLSDAPIDDGSKDSLSEENAPNVSSVDESRVSSSKENVSNINEENLYSNGCKEDYGSVKLLTEKLSAALLNVSLKDDLVKQHAKVAEEAVAGWEKAENEAATLKQKLDASVQQKSALEARVTHLDEALKECVRQLRLSRDEQEKKINQAVAEKTNELEVAKTQLEEHLLELRNLVETSRVNSPDLELRHKLEILERENLVLRRELQSQSEELEIRTIERDLSTKAAETASKQHLESIKKVAKLEAESRRLKSSSRVSSSSYDHKSNAAASSCVDSVVDSHLDSGERLSGSEFDTCKINGLGSHECHPGRSSSVEIHLMDDFLEMERLAALPGSRHRAFEEPVTGIESELRTELESVVHRVGELEEKIKDMEVEKSELVTALVQTRSCLESSQVQLIETQMKFEQVERELHGASEMERFYKLQVSSFERDAKSMSSKIKSFKLEIDRERALSVAKSAKCEEMEIELRKKEEELQIHRDTISNEELKKEEMDLAQTQDCLDKSLAQLREGEMKLEELEKELSEANQENISLKTQLDSARIEVRTMSNKIDSLNEQVHEQQALTAELSTKCKELENELCRKRHELEVQQKANSNIKPKINKEDLAAAAGKLADCQKTIASLGSQLKSLATLEDFLIDTTSIPGFSPPAPLMAQHDSEPWKLHSNDTFLVDKEHEDGLSPFAIYNRRETSRESLASSSKSSISSAFFMNHPGSNKVGNSFAKYFPLTRD